MYIRQYFYSKLTFIYNERIEAKFKINCLIQDDDISFTIFYFVVNFFVDFELDTRLKI